MTNADIHVYQTRDGCYRCRVTYGNTTVYTGKHITLYAAVWNAAKLAEKGKNG